MDIYLKEYFSVIICLLFLFSFYFSWPFFDGIKIKELLNCRKEYLEQADEVRENNRERKKLLRLAGRCFNEAERVKKNYLAKFDLRRFFFRLGCEE